MIVVTLRDHLTKGEHALAQCGLATEVLALRRALHNAMRDDMITAIEELSGRDVQAFLADGLLDPDVAGEIFLLHPADGTAA